AENDLRELHNDRALERLAEAADALAEQRGAGRATPGTRRDYLRWLIGRNLYLDPRGSFQTQRQVQLRLDEVYISLCARPDERDDPADKAMLERELAALEAQLAGLPDDEAEDQREDLRDLLLRRARTQLPAGQPPAEQRQELTAVVTAHPRLVILGDPGSGKSTLLRFLALKHAEALRDGRTEAEGGLGRARFPILVRIADYAEHGLARPLSDWLGEDCVLNECPRSGLADLLAEELRRGGCLVLLDGLDEIVDPRDRQTVLGRIEDFVRWHDHGDNCFIVTSRPAGYRRAQLSGDQFEHYSVQEMDDEQIRRFLERWCHAVEDAQTPDAPPERRQEVARRQIDGIMRAVANPSVQRLAANPLLLRILALIHRSGAQLPQNQIHHTDAWLPQKRVELYQLVADTLARTWRTAHGVPETALVQEEYLTPLLSRLAYWMQANRATGLASEREVYAVLGAEWAEIHDEDWNPHRPSPKIKEQISNFLVRVREHTGLFVERAPRLYGFLHLTFQEYYAARYLVASSATRAGLIRQHLHDPRWDEPILLALGYVGLDSPKKATELLETAVLAQGAEAARLGLRSSRHEELLGRDYLFALRCLADQIPIRSRLLRPLIERLAEETLRRSGLAVYTRYRELLGQRLQALGGEAAAQLVLLLSEGLRDADAGVRRSAVSALGRLGGGVEGVVGALWAALEHSDPDMRWRAVEALGRLGGRVEGVVGALRAALEDSHPNVRRSAVAALEGPGGGVEVEGALRAVLEDSHPNVRRSAVAALGRLGGGVEGVVGALWAALEHSDPNVRASAVEALGRLGDTTDTLRVQALNGFAEATDSEVRQWIAAYLGHAAQSDPAVLDALQGGLLDRDGDVRRACAAALVQLGRRFPNHVAQIEGRLLHAIHDPAFGGRHQDWLSYRTGQDYAHEGLWLLVAGV
ncbi:MAG TPA: HEAT repeat domain-containing protein, partial [Roseiflexaceae bacterium]|nr:HEAT repeat domain-containing protein [Roseiflexaceae bacterium]